MKTIEEIDRELEFIRKEAKRLESLRQKWADDQVTRYNGIAQTLLEFRRSIQMGGLGGKPIGDPTALDTPRIDWLEKQANIPPGILLHDGSTHDTGWPGLGLRPAKSSRTLREAIDLAMRTGRLTQT